MDNEAYVYQKAFNNGQAQVNYRLVEVDTKLIEGLNALVAILKTLKDEHASPPPIREIDLSSLVAAVKAATEISGKVASIDPPGCKKPYPDPDPTPGP